MNIRFLITTGLCGIAAMLANPAFATEAADGAADESSSADDIIVTANKREQSANKVGITITALGGEELARRQISSLSDVANAVPGLVFSPSTANTPIFTLRGVGFNEKALGVYPAVSVYMDQIPLPFPVLASHAAFDLERIEVLKGPQGTLFGQNATGGAINYIAAKPTDEWMGSGSLGYGRFNRVELNGVVSGPLADGIGVRLAVQGVHSSDWQQSATRDDTLGKEEYLAGRLLVDLNMSGPIRAQLNLNGWIDKSDPQALQYFLLLPNPPGVNEAVQNFPFANLDPRSADWSTGEYRPRADRRFGQAALRVDGDLTSDLTITSLTSFIAFKQEQTADGDGMSLALLNNSPDDGTIDSFTQELRIANNPGGRLNWLVGANLEKSKVKQRQDIYFPDGSVNNPGNLNIFQNANQTRQDFSTLAAFVSGDYAITDRLTLKAGIRYTSSEIKANLCGMDAGDGRINELFTLLGNLLSGTVVPPLQPGDCYSMNEKNIPGEPFIDRLKEDNVSWRGGLDFQVNPDLLLYGNISRGYKAGSYPTIAAATTVQLSPARQEHVTAYEAGFKARIIDRTLQLNGAAFYYDYGDKQVLGKVLDPIFGLLDKLINVPKSRIIGAELEASWTPSDNISVRAGGTYINSRVQDYSGYDVLGVVQDFEGVALPFTPKWTYSLDAEYHTPDLISGGEFFVGATLTGKSAQDAVFAGDRVSLPNRPGAKVVDNLAHPFHIDAYATVDGRIGYNADSGWQAMAYVKNAFNKYYIANVIPGADNSARFAGRPVTYGVQVGFDF